MLFTRAEPPEEQSSGSQHPRCVFLQRNLAPGQTARRRGINISGVDFWHAVEFSRNRHFHRTHPRHSLEAFLRALPFGDSDSTRSFSVSLTTLLRTCGSDLEKGSGKLDAAGPRDLIMS